MMALAAQYMRNHDLVTLDIRGASSHIELSGRTPSPCGFAPQRDQYRHPGPRHPCARPRTVQAPPVDKRAPM